MRPHVNFVSHALNFLDECERSIDERKKREDKEAEKLAMENKATTESAGFPADIRLERRMELLNLREQNQVILPLNARYTALVSAVAGMEWLVRSLHAAHRGGMAEFARNEEEKKIGSGESHAARKFAEMRDVVQDWRIRQGGVVDTLKRIAKWANLREEDNAREVFADLCVARNAVVHCGGAVEAFNDPRQLRGALGRLNGFRAVSEMKAGKAGELGVKFMMPLSEEQIWIERDALRPLAGRALSFILEVHKAHFGP